MIEKRSNVAAPLPTLYQPFTILIDHSKATAQFLGSIRTTSRHSFQRKRDPLPATDAERDNSLVDPVALHRMQKTRRKHCA